MADASVAERLGRALGRHDAVIRYVTGLALSIAALATLALSLPDALAPIRYETVRRESTAPPGSLACFTETADGIRISPPDGSANQHCIDPHIFDHDARIDINSTERHRGRFGALTSSIAVMVGWRLWRPARGQGHPIVQRRRTTIAAVGLSPLAAITILAAARILYWFYRTLT